MADSLPVLQGHWRLLEKHEMKCAGDKALRLSSATWFDIHSSEYGFGVGHDIIIRRVAPIPKCETCSNSTVDPKMVQQFSSDCDLAPGQADERVCLVWEAFVPHDGYCHLHPQAQEVTR